MDINFKKMKILHKSVYLEKQVSIEIDEPQVPPCEDWGNYGKTWRREKEVVGVYISGHPLDDFKIEMSTFCNANCILNLKYESII